MQELNYIELAKASSKMQHGSQLATCFSCMVTIFFSFHYVSQMLIRSFRNVIWEASCSFWFYRKAVKLPSTINSLVKRQTYLIYSISVFLFCYLKETSFNSSNCSCCLLCLLFFVAVLLNQAKNIMYGGVKRKPNMGPKTGYYGA